MVYERYSGGWRSRFVGARSNFHVGFDGARLRLRGSPENISRCHVSRIREGEMGKGRYG